VRIDGVRSAETKIPGVKESTVDVLLNLKKLAIQVPSGEPKVLRIEVSGPKTVTGADVPETDVEVVNPEIHLFTIESTARVTMELGVGIGRGYEAVDRATTAVPAGALALDAAYSPITKVAYNVEMSRLGKITDYEKLVLEIWTSGAVTPGEALTRSAIYLRDHFGIVDRSGQAVRLEWSGSEIAGDVLTIRMRGRVAGGLSGAKVNNRLLTDRFADQVNVVRASYDRRAATLIFTRGDGPKALP